MPGENETVEDLTEVSAPVAVITGATSGIGLAAAIELARRGWALALVGRDQARLDAALDLVRAAAADAAADQDGRTAGPGPTRRPATIDGFLADFSSFDSVRELAKRLRDAYSHIDVLANNAGGAFPTRKTTVDGFDQTIQVNYLAQFLLSHLLRDRLAGGRIVNTASVAHRQGSLDPDDLSGDRVRHRMLASYGSAKQADILFAAEAARRWPEIVSTSYHPGVVRTRFGNERRMYAIFYRMMPGLRTPEKGAQTLVWLATTTDPVTNGGYYLDRRPRRPAAKAVDPALAARLWAVSLSAVGLDG